MSRKYAGDGRVAPVADGEALGCLAQPGVATNGKLQSCRTGLWVAAAEAIAQPVAPAIYKLKNAAAARGDLDLLRETGTGVVMRCVSLCFFGATDENLAKSDV